ncbi:hypothetical protein CBR_g31527 [Chara braunii]|uniref:Ubiquitin-like domain-containing protein n=1 Tax=Chara braunii TaxID=69332 RepID=A0A388LF74_CHABU|nr:hypothetical protein CBR_g31527 [Chara braunii]|eukprot:GBG80970.1 hypothetical protein CBR_g31527 [Chara braunii]
MVGWLCPSILSVQVENVKAIIEVEIQVPIANQRLFLNGRALSNASHLNQAGVGEGDLLLLQTIESGSRPQRSGGGDPNLAMNPDGSAANPLALQRHLRQDQNLMRRLLEVQSSL